MEEKVLIQSERHNIKRMLSIFIVLAIVAILSFFAIEFVKEYQHAYQDYIYFEEQHEKSPTWFEWVEQYGSPAQYARKCALDGIDYWDANVIIGESMAVLLLIIGFWSYFWLSKIDLIVTDKRVYGTAAFGKRVDLPLDSVSAIGTSWPKGIAVATSSGKISFLAIKNCDDIHKVLSNLLIERQSKAPAPVQTTIKQEVSQSSADELKKFKELLDGGVITQEEFDAKKKQLLGL